METTNTPSWREANIQAAKEIGGHSAVARALGYPTRASVFPWTSGKRQFPPEVCYTVEKHAKTITRRELRPDDWEKIWPELINKRAKKVVDAVTAAAA